MNKKVEKVQKYLKGKGVAATEDEIIEAAIRIATRWSSYDVFVCEFRPARRRKGW